jgi:Glycosyltransferase 61
MTGEASDDLSTIAELLRERTAAAGHDNRASLTVVVPATERVRFSKQIERMQETDILVAPHGSPLTDTLFMRPGAAVIEIHPFSYQSGMFQGIAHQLGLGHAKLSAEPDVKMFDACISRYNNKTGTAGVSAVVERLQLAADEYKLTGKATLHLEDGGRDFQDVHEIKQCARRQRLRIDSSRLADEIWRSAQHICSLPAAAVPGGRGESSPSTPHPVQDSVTR